MSFEYLYDDLPAEHRPTGGVLHFQLPEYLYDAPPTLARGGGAEALHPAQAAQWFANSGFDHGTQYPQYTPSFTSYPAVQDAYESLETLYDAFPPAHAHPHNPFTSYSHPHPHSLNASPPPHTPSPVTGPPAHLPVYSQSGFDIVSLLGRVQSRVNPHIQLGPVDFTTSFIVVDVRRHDDPVVYCSPSFCALTGYAEREVLGRNCRFLQAPPPPAGVGGGLAKGDERRHTSPTAVRALAKAVSAHKEAQVSMVNYRKDGSAFVNLVSVVPLFGEHVDDPTGECVWFVGFQIDLTKQSEGIMERVREGRYYADAALALQREQQKTKAMIEPPPVPPKERERRTTAVPPPTVSAALARLLTNQSFLASCGVQPGAVSSTSAGGLPPDPTSHALHSLLLGELPDFVHVLSLKGAFLYVAPAVTRVLGWEPAELVGRALADVCFARDVVSVGRALKEASLPVAVEGGMRIPAEASLGSAENKDKDKDGDILNSGSNSSSGNDTPTPAEALRTVDLVFRARTKGGSWVWVECRGRLHVEPGKGRKAIVLVGRARGMARVPVVDIDTVTDEVDYTSPHTHDAPAAAYAPHLSTPTTPTYPAANRNRSPSGSVTGLEYALQPKRARIEDAYTRGSSSTLRTPSPLSVDTAHTHTSAAVPTAFHGLLDPYGLLLSVGAGARAVLGWDPLSLRGTRLGSLVAPSPSSSSARLSPSPVDTLLASWRAARAADPENAAACVREVKCVLRGRDGPVEVVVRVVAPLPEPHPGLPPAVAPAQLMYTVRRAGVPVVPRAGVEGDVFRRLDTKTGGSWQYELQQLRFANARLEEEIVELERAEKEREAVKEREREGVRERERERERERIRMEQRRYEGVYQHQQQQQLAMYGYDEQQPQQWGYAHPAPPLMYQVPMKRAWDRRDDI
ncbi:hypothetical protein B0H19DRAFT_1148539 [Mycena capillaripes]|nr:hypothetical protein B0H19DRAFT_1148539 [Mycena capillaripes]